LAPSFQARQIGENEPVTILCQAGLPGKPGRCITIPPGGPVWPHPHSGPKPEDAEGQYPGLVIDASILSGIHQAIKTVSDRETREALQKGVESAVKAFERRCGNGATLTLDD
jgi:hypothetical protein